MHVVGFFPDTLYMCTGRSRNHWKDDDDDDAGRTGSIRGLQHTGYNLMTPKVQQLTVRQHACTITDKKKPSTRITTTSSTRRLYSTVLYVLY